MKNIIFLSIVMFLLYSCKSGNKKSDAYGNFEATEIVISSESTGKLLKFAIEEGDIIDSGKLIGIIDTLQLNLKLQQVKSQRNAIKTKFGNIYAQINVLNQQKATLNIEKDRIEKLLADNAATKQQHDQIIGQISLLDKQIDQIRVQNSTTVNEIDAYESQIKQTEDLISRCKIVNPIAGTILTKYFEPNELVVAGKPLYKIADLSKMKLKVYVDGSQLSTIKLGQTVTVVVDSENNTTKNYEGKIIYISEQAEFTPKIIQTREERVNLVYAIKILVNNDGYIKIGNPGEILFNLNN